MEPPEPSTNESGAFVLAIEGRVDRAFVPVLCEWIRTALASCAGSVVICDVANVVEPSAATVEALARAQLTALRAGGLVRLRGADDDLCCLLDLMGLEDDVLPRDPGPC